MSRSRIALVVLAVIALAFAVAVGLGVSRDDEDREVQAESRPGLVERLDALLARLGLSAAVGPDELRIKTGCTLSESTLAIPRGASCEMSVRPSQTRFRKLKLRLAAGALDTVSYKPVRPADDKLAEQGFTLPLKNELTDQLPWADQDASDGSLTIYRDGGTLLVRCSWGANCRVTVAR
ncbi:MAG: hypothetical protein HY704_01385 [Gemmatimonadetes bacterium]|nr:hypothetical protein [Gemmatimonadota bacterium]